MTASLSLSVLSPGPNEVVQPGPLEVSGWVSDQGMPEPILASVTVQGKAAALHVVTPVKSVWQASFSADVTMPDSGSAVISVTATDDLGRRRSESVTVFVGHGPVEATLNSPLPTLNSALVFQSSAAAIALQFTQSSVEIIPPLSITFQPVTIFQLNGDINLNVTMALNSSSSGTFNPGNGSISIPVILAVHATISGLPFGYVPQANATLTTTLTTEKSNSSAFNDQGISLPLQPEPSATVKLVGDGIYFSPPGSLPGIFGMTEGGIILFGTISPSP
jgi:hypothetical protein